MQEFKAKKTKEKLFSKLWFKNYGLIVLGSVIITSGYVFFIVPLAINIQCPISTKINLDVKN